MCADMQACVKTAQGEVQMLDLPRPVPGPRDVVVQTSVASVCGSDLHFLDDMTSEGVEYLFPGTLIEEGLPMGHEAVGVVAEAGDKVTRFAEGDRVVVGSLTACGRCDECLRGQQSICTGGGKLLYGCQAEYYLVPDAELVTARVPDAVPDEHAMFTTDIMSVGFSAIEKAEAPFGSSVAVFAQGPVGLCVTAAARSGGFGLVVAVDTLDERLEVSKKLGANVVLNAAEVDPVEAIYDLTGGKGVDVAVEAVGTQPTFDAATRAVRPGGTVTSVGIYANYPTLEMSTHTSSFLQRRIITTLAPTGRPRLEELLALLEHGDVDLSPLLTHRMKLSDTPAAYDLFRSRADGVLKIALTP